jgi:hypothetical protein
LKVDERINTTLVVLENVKKKILLFSIYRKKDRLAENITVNKGIRD